MNRYYDATTEHKPFEKSETKSKGHPNKGLTSRNPYSGVQGKNRYPDVV